LTEGYDEIVFDTEGSWHSDPYEQCHALNYIVFLVIQGKCAEYFENL